MLKLYRDGIGKDAYAAENLDHAKRLLTELVGEEEAKEYDDWSEIPDDKTITVDCDGEKVTKTAAEWANDGSPPGVRFGANY